MFLIEYSQLNFDQLMNIRSIHNFLQEKISFKQKSKFINLALNNKFLNYVI